MVVSKDGCQAQRFLAVDVYQMSLVEPESKRLGWGVVKFAGLLQVRGEGGEVSSEALPSPDRLLLSSAFHRWFSVSQLAGSDLCSPATHVVLLFLLKAAQK